MPCHMKPVWPRDETSLAAVLCPLQQCLAVSAPSVSAAALLAACEGIPKARAPARRVETQRNAFASLHPPAQAPGPTGDTRESLQHGSSAPPCAVECLLTTLSRRHTECWKRASEPCRRLLGERLQRRPIAVPASQARPCWLRHGGRATVPTAPRVPGCLHVQILPRGRTICKESTLGDARGIRIERIGRPVYNIAWVRASVCVCGGGGA